MHLPPTLAWLLDEAGTLRGADQFLATLGAKLIGDGLPLLGGALTSTATHPIIARRTWLWRAETGAVIEALGFGAMGMPGAPGGAEPGKVGRDWLAGLGAGPVQEDVAAPSGSPASAGPFLAWALSRPLDESQSRLLHQVARFAAAPLAVLRSNRHLGFPRRRICDSWSSRFVDLEFPDGQAVRTF